MGFGTASIRRALLELENQGKVVRVTGRFQLPNFGALRHENGRGSIVFITRGDEAGHIVSFSNRFREFDSELARECFQAHLNLYRLGVEPGENPRIAQSRMAEFLRRWQPIGVVIWSKCFPSVLFNALLHTVLLRHVPTVIIDEDPDTKQISQRPANEGKARKITLSPAGLSAGIEMGRTLLGLGHRRIAFLTSDASSSWSRVRWEGMRTACQSIGSGLAILEMNFNPDIKGWGSGAFGMYDDRIHKAFHSIRMGSAQPSQDRLVFDAYHILVKIWRSGNLFQQWLPILGPFLGKHQPTALVGASDELALLAYDILNQKGNSSVTASPKPALFGFDGTRDAQEQGIVTYAFDFAGMARVAVGFLVNPKLPKGQSGTLINHPGYLVKI